MLKIGRRSPGSIKRTGRKMNNRSASKYERAQIKRYNKETKSEARLAKARTKSLTINAKNKMPIEKAKLNAKVANNATWASAVTSVFGKGANVANNAIDASQNVNGGLQNTESTRQEDSNDNTADSGGVGY